MSNSEARQLIDAVIALIADGRTAKEIAETLNIKEAAVSVIESKLDIIRF